MSGHARWLDKIKVLSKVMVVRGDPSADSTSPLQASSGQVQFLAIRRSEGDRRRPNAWDLPGGNFEKGEQVMVSARREVEEEVGLRVGKLRPIYVDSRVGRREEGLDVIAIAYVAEYEGGEVKLSEEHREYRWVTGEEFLELPVGDDGGFFKRAVREWMSLKR